MQQSLLFRQYSRGLRICINAKWLLGFFSLHNEKNSKYFWIFFLISCTFSILLVRLTCTFYSFQIYMAFSGLAFLLKKKNFDFLSRKKILLLPWVIPSRFDYRKAFLATSKHMLAHGKYMFILIVLLFD